MHPSGKMPAYEFNFSDVNPPVHAWACWRVYKMTGPRRQARPGVSGQRVSEAAPGFHLVGQSQGPDGPEHLFGRIPGAGQHRPVRSIQAAAQRRVHCRRPMRPPGWPSSAARCCRWPWNWPGTTQPTRTWPPSSSSTSSPSPTPSTRSAARGLWDEDGRLLLRPDSVRGRDRGR